MNADIRHECHDCGTVKFHPPSTARRLRSPYRCAKCTRQLSVNKRRSNGLSVGFESKLAKHNSNFMAAVTRDLTDGFGAEDILVRQRKNFPSLTLSDVQREISIRRLDGSLAELVAISRRRAAQDRRSRTA